MAAEAATSLYSEALLLLAGAVIAAPAFKRIGLGTVLGYLAAGAVIGPIARLISEPEEVLKFGELGVVFLLFVIGLELKPSRLWSLRRAIFGLGTAQVAVTGLVLAAIGRFGFGESNAAAIIGGFGMALSSTAFAMQLLEQEGARNLPRGQTAFSILLLQDMAIVPLLLLVPLLAPHGDASEGFSMPDMAIAAAALASIVLAGRFLLNPLFRIIASSQAREAMIAATLLVVLGAAWLSGQAGLSMGMGAFVAGVLMAESSFRHELEADIEPFRGLLLGLFFMAVGMSLDLGVILDRWGFLILAVPTLMLTKAVILYAITRIGGTRHNDALRIAALLSQGGEFAFVLFTAATAAGIVAPAAASLFIATVTLSMALTPLAVNLAKRFVVHAPAETMDEKFENAGSDVLLIGFSRFGQIVAQTLLAGGIDVTVIDNSAERVRTVARFGFKIYFGDGRRREVLEAAGIRRARIVAVCTNDKDTTSRIVTLIQSEFAETRLFVRSYDRTHSLELRQAGVDYELRETLESALLFGRRTLEGLGTADLAAAEIIDDVRQRDEERLKLQQREGIAAGRDLLYRRPATPEPLIKPARESRRLDPDAVGETGEKEKT